ncbi:polysaccharide biosynthesis protein [Brevibacillus dissolubilis]|uniref:polysaccharide biosynthesis protein n=1 Tax=Brevibacillus dissolubilis TaxID=1844116 RepID=UPI00111764EF|nr:nucleoside-diphosphate sugar epimerase/dehydratase [Brevibacillus dissolubilis]
MNYKQRMLAFMPVDAGIVFLSVYISYLLRFDGDIPRQFLSGMPYVLASTFLITLVSFHFYNLYSRVWQYAGIGELVSIIRAVTLGMLFNCLFHVGLRFLDVEVVVPLSVFLMIWAMLIIGTGGSRFIWRIIHDSYQKKSVRQKRALIIGAGNAGAVVVREMRGSTQSEHFIVGLIDDDPRKLHLNVIGVPVIGSRDDIQRLVKEKDVDTIIIAIPSAPREEIAKIINICKETSAQIKIFPRVSDIILGNVSVNHIRDVNVEDLLGRDPVEVDLKGIADYVTDQVVLVTGAGGSIGSELTRQISPFRPKELLLLGHGENSIYSIEMELRNKFPQMKITSLIADIQDRRRMREIFATYGPSVVFHAAAHKHVPLMEANPLEAIKNNVYGTKNVAECAHEFSCSHFVMISTDKAVNPTSVMGVTKRIAEMIVQSLDKISNTKFVAVRFGNVLGSRGSVIPLFKKQIDAGGPVTVTHPDMIRYFMTIPEAVQLVIQAGALADGGEVFILDMGKPVKISDLARDLIRLSGLEPEKDIKIVYSGIRPGEKLFEEILTKEEGTQATQHNRIFVGKSSDLTYSGMQEMLKDLEAILNEKERIIPVEEIKRTFKGIVHTYKWPEVPEKPIIHTYDLPKKQKELTLAKKEIATSTID